MHAVSGEGGWGMGLCLGVCGVAVHRCGGVSGFVGCALM